MGYCPKIFNKKFIKVITKYFYIFWKYCTICGYKAFDCIKSFDNIVKNYKENRDKSSKILEKMSLLEYSIPSGAFYFYINIEKLKIDSSDLVKNY